MPPARELLRWVHLADDMTFHEFADALPQIVWSASADGRIDFFNKAWFEWTGLPRQTVGTSAWLDIVHPEDVTATKEVWEACVRSGREYRIEYRLKDRRTNGYRWHLAQALPFRLTGADTLRWFGTCTDIDEQKRLQEALASSEAALRRSDERYRSLVSVLTSVVWMTDASGAFAFPQVDWNRYTGQTWEGQRGWGWLDMIHPKDRELVVETWKHAVKSHTTYKIEGRIWSQAHRGYRYFEARAVPLCDADGTVREWVGTITDVHDRKSMEVELLTSNEAYRQVLEKLKQSQSELEDKLRELEAFHDVVVGRELKMIEMEKELNRYRALLPNSA
ncbi:PAS domain-containing protein [Candidatus Nitrospira bockiana]